MSQTLVKIMEEVKALSETERRQLATLLANLNHSPSAPLSESELENCLATEGWLTLPERPTHDRSTTPLIAPLEVRGRPCSEVLVEERR